MCTAVLSWEAEPGALRTRSRPRHITPSGSCAVFTFVNAVFTFVNRRSRCQPTRFAREWAHDTSSTTWRV